MNRWEVLGCCLFAAAAVAFGLLAEERLAAWRFDRRTRQATARRGRTDRATMTRWLDVTAAGAHDDPMVRRRGCLPAPEPYDWADETLDRWAAELDDAVRILGPSSHPERPWAGLTCEQRGFVCCEGPLEAMPRNCGVRRTISSGELAWHGMAIPDSWGLPTVDD